MTALLSEQVRTNPTVVLPSPDALAKKFDHSIVALDSVGQIIGNSTVDPYEDQETHDHALRFGCGGTLIVDPKHRWEGLGETLMTTSDRLLSQNYDIVFSATFSKRVRKVRENMWFICLPGGPAKYVEKVIDLFVPDIMPAEQLCATLFWLGRHNPNTMTDQKMEQVVQWFRSILAN